MQRRRHPALTDAPRLRRAVALVMALVFVALSATAALAHGPGIDPGSRLAMQDLLVPEHISRQADPGEDGEKAPLPHLLPCHCHAIIGGNPMPYEIPVAAGAIGRCPMPGTEAPRRSREAAPPDRPPCR